VHSASLLHVAKGLLPPASIAVAIPRGTVQVDALTRCALGTPSVAGGAPPPEPSLALVLPAPPPATLGADEPAVQCARPEKTLVRRANEIT